MEVFLMIVGFSLAAYSIVANDAIQTLGTFLESNAKRPWWVLWIFACSILLSVVLYSWFANGGDPAYGRLEKFPMPEGGLNWLYVIPPIVILVLTRFGIPVSTTFLVLSIFAASNVGGMLNKSIMGYLVAFAVAIALYFLVFRRLTEYFIKTQGEEAPKYWTALQWISTGWLWANWLIQDLANIYAYLPRQVEGWVMALSLVWLLVLHAWVFKERGGAVQSIVTSKTGTNDIRAATIIDFIYGIILFVFKEMSNLPMSTTWVFLGLLAGREFAIALHMHTRSKREVGKIIGSDVGKAGIGLLVSLVLAFGLPWLYQLTNGGATTAINN